MEPRTIAVVLSWNLKERVLECLSTLLKEKSLEKVILVDNASDDGTPKAVGTSLPHVELIENKRNLGYAGGNNVGIRRAIEHGADFILLVNSDALPMEGSVERLIKAAIEENAGVVGGKPVRMDNQKILDAAWGVINWRNMASRLEGEGASDGPQFSSRRRVDYPLGVALLLNAKALQEVGLFDEDYFAYHEEMELCWRMKLQGWPVIFEPAPFLHGRSESLKRAGAHNAREYLLARNSVRFVSKYGSISQKVKFWTFVLAASVLKLPLAILKGRLQAHVALMRGWSDGLLDRQVDDNILKKYGLLK